jgi:Flp pilus assembly protein TadG
MVEMALTTPLFILLIMGTFELGRVAYYAIEVANAARAGASYGAVNRGNATVSATIQQAAANDAPDLPNLVTTAGTACVCQTITTSSGTTTETFNPSSGTTSCSSFTGSNASVCSADSSTQNTSVIYYVTVSTQTNLDPLIHVPGLPNTYSLHGYSEMRVLPN